MLFHQHFYCDDSTREEDCKQNLLCTQRTFSNYWAFAVFRDPDLIANLSDGLKIMDPGFNRGVGTILTLGRHVCRAPKARVLRGRARERVLPLVGGGGGGGSPRKF